MGEKRSSLKDDTYPHRPHPLNIVFRGVSDSPGPCISRASRAPYFRYESVVLINNGSAEEKA